MLKKPPYGLPFSERYLQKAYIERNWKFGVQHQWENEWKQYMKVPNNGLPDIFLLPSFISLPVFFSFSLISNILATLRNSTGCAVFKMKTRKKDIKKEIILGDLKGGDKWVYIYIRQVSHSLYDVRLYAFALSSVY